ncbi:hypothetical protein [Neobacillus cucumis]
MENPKELTKNMIKWMIKHDYKVKDIQKIIGENALQVLRKNLN